MGVTPSGTDVSVAYTTQALVQRYVPAGSFSDVDPPRAGTISTIDLAAMMREHSRIVDARLAAVGVEVPFPAAGATNPECPPIVQRIVTFLVAGEVRMIAAAGNRQNVTGSTYSKQAEEQLKAVEAKPSLLGRGRVLTPELFDVDARTEQRGNLIGQMVRLRNRNVIPDTIRFADSTGREVLRPEGLPIQEGLSWATISAPESIIMLLERSMILAQCGTNGGVIYEFSWRKLDWGQTGFPIVTGVSRL